MVAADLSEVDSADKFFAATEAAGVQVDISINNGGVGGYGKFHELIRG